MGIAKALRGVNRNIFIAAVEPEESAVMSGGEPGLHEIGGIGDGFIPALVRDEGTLTPIIEEVIQIKSDEAISESKKLARNFGFCVGVSSGANFLAAKRLKKRFQNVVTVFPDGFTRYESLGLGPSGRCGFHGYACRRHKEIVAGLRKSV
jgi:cysteine synthase A